MTRPVNGKCPTDALVLVQTGTYKGLPYSIYLETATAAAFKQAQDAGGLSISPPLGGDRSLLDQEHLKDEPGQYGSSLPQSKIAAPGTSTHGYGDCVDIQAGNAWFQVHCGAYGFVRESPAGENNHYRYLHPTWAEATTTASTGTTTAPKPPEMRDKMRLLPQDTTSTYFLEVEGVGLYTVPDQATADTIFRYLNPPATPAAGTLARADIDAVAAILAGPPTYKAFYAPKTSVTGTVTTPAPIDYAALAKAVNDDAAKRLAS